MKWDLRGIARRRTSGSIAVMVALTVALVGMAPSQALAASDRTVATRATLEVGVETLTLDLMMPYRGARTVNGPVSVIVSLPDDTSGSVTNSDKGFNGRGYAIEFRTSTRTDGKVLVQVTVPASHSRTSFEAILSAASGYATLKPARTNHTVILEAWAV